MGVDTPCYKHHSYFTAGLQAKAVLYYNNTDIGKNKVHIEQSVKDYCQSKDECQRKQILEYFGFKSVKQPNCCCVCDVDTNVTANAMQDVRLKVRKSAC